MAIEQVLSRFQAISDRAQHLDRASDRVFEVCESDVQQRFNSAPEVRSTAQVYGGQTWERLTEPYIKSAGRSGQMLRISGDLHSQFRRGQSGNVAEASNNSFKFGANSPKAKGLHRKRALIFIHPELTGKVTNVLKNYLIRGIK